MATPLTSPKKDAFTIIEEAFKERGTQTHPSIYKNLLDYLRKNRYTHKKSYKYYRKYLIQDTCHRGIDLLVNFQFR